MRIIRLAAILAVVSSTALATAAQQVTKETVPGVTNLARLETTVACAGAVKVEAVPEIKKMGFASIINLRQASEPGAHRCRALRPSSGIRSTTSHNGHGSRRRPILAAITSKKRAAFFTVPN